MRSQFALALLKWRLWTIDLDVLAAMLDMASLGPDIIMFSFHICSLFCFQIDISLVTQMVPQSTIVVSLA